VVLGTGALAVATLVSLLSAAAVLAFLVRHWFGFLPALVTSLGYGALPSILLAFCFGAPLAFLLQPVRNQWLHVAAFAGLGAVLGLIFTPIAAGPSARPDYALTFAVTAALTGGCSLALGRFAVWRLVRLNQDDERQDENHPCSLDHP
jgi:hypothetical protein